MYLFFTNVITRPRTRCVIPLVLFNMSDLNTVFIFNESDIVRFTTGPVCKNYSFTSRYPIELTFSPNVIGTQPYKIYFLIYFKKSNKPNNMKCTKS